MGWLKSPKKAAYNKVYGKTSFGLKDLLKKYKAPEQQHNILFTAYTMCLQIEGDINEENYYIGLHIETG